MVQCDPHPIFRVRKGHNEGLKAFKLAVSTSRQVLQSVLYIFNLTFRYLTLVQLTTINPLFCGAQSDLECQGPPPTPHPATAQAS